MKYYRETLAFILLIWTLAGCGRRIPTPGQVIAGSGVGIDGAGALQTTHCSVKDSQGRMTGCADYQYKNYVGQAYCEYVGLSTESACPRGGNFAFGCTITSPNCSTAECGSYTYYYYDVNGSYRTSASQTQAEQVLCSKGTVIH